MSSGSVNEVDKLTPKRFFLAEEAINGKVGESLLADMVRGSLFNDKPALPPPDVFKWYVHFVTFEYIKWEHEWLFVNHTEEAEVAYGMLAKELEIVLSLLASQKMFGLQAEVQGMLKTRKLYLPETFQPLVG